MKNNLDIDKIIQLRKLLRTTWQAYASSMITLDNSMHNELKTNMEKKNGLVLTGEPINVYLDDRSIVFIQVYNLNAIDISKMAYWIDGYIHYVEKKLHDLIIPNTKWEGFNPQNF